MKKVKVESPMGDIFREKHEYPLDRFAEVNKKVNERRAQEDRKDAEHTRIANGQK